MTTNRLSQANSSNIPDKRPYLSEGSHEVLTQLFTSRRAHYVSRAMKYLKSKELAEDIVQDLYLKLIGSLGMFNGKGTLEAWSDRVLVNMCLDQLNITKRRAEILTSYKIERKPKLPDQVLQRKELESLIKSLPNGYRTVLEKYGIEGYSHQEIADDLGLAESTSRSQLTKARAKLKALMR